MERYWMIGGAAVLGLLLVAGVAVALLRSETELEPGTPESAVQVYLRALRADDFEAAHAALSPELQEQCTPEEFFKRTSRSRSRFEDARFTLDDVKEVNETTFVTVRIAEYHDGGIFGSSKWSRDERFGLRMVDGEWRLVEEPWPLSRCQPISDPPAEARPAD